MVKAKMTYFYLNSLLKNKSFWLYYLYLFIFFCKSLYFKYKKHIFYKREMFIKNKLSKYKENYIKKPKIFLRDEMDKDIMRMFTLIIKRLDLVKI